jgi:hypothetical protein
MFNEYQQKVFNSSTKIVVGFINEVPFNVVMGKTEAQIEVFLTSTLDEGKSSSLCSSRFIPDRNRLTY